MAYGKECPVCGAMVDNNEFDYGRFMCKECAEEMDLEDARRLDVERIMNSKFTQIRTEDILCNGY